MSAFINIKDSEREDIRNFSAAYNENWEALKKKEMDEFEKHGAIKKGSGIDSAAYGFKGVSDNRNRFAGVLRGWYMYNGLSVEEILSDNEEDLQKRIDLMDSFNKTFTRQAGDTEESYNKRVFDNLASMSAMMNNAGIGAAVPDPNKEYDAESFKSMVNHAYVYNDIAINISQIFNNGNFLDERINNIGISYNTDFRQKTVNAGVWSFTQRLSSSLMDVMSSENEYTNNSFENQEAADSFMDSLSVVEAYKDIYEKYPDVITGNASPKNMSNSTKVAVSSALSSREQATAETFASVFTDDYTAPEPERSENTRTLDANFADMSPEVFIAYLAGAQAANPNLGSTLDNIYMGDRSIAELLGEGGANHMDLEAAHGNMIAAAAYAIRSNLYSDAPQTVTFRDNGNIVSVYEQPVLNNENMLDPFYFVQTPEQLLSSLAGRDLSRYELDNFIQNIYINGKSLENVTPEQAAESIKNAMKLESADDVAIRTQDGFRPVLPPYPVSDIEENRDHTPRSRINSANGYNPPDAVAKRYNDKVNESKLHSRLCALEEVSLEEMEQARESKARFYNETYGQYAITSAEIMEQVINDPSAAERIIIGDRKLSAIMNRENAEFNNVKDYLDKAFTDGTPVLLVSEDGLKYTPVLDEVGDRSISDIAEQFSKAAQSMEIPKNAEKKAAEIKTLLGDKGFIMEPDEDIAQKMLASRGLPDHNVGNIRTADAYHAFAYIYTITERSRNIDYSEDPGYIVNVMDSIHIDGKSVLSDMTLPEPLTMDNMIDVLAPQVNKKIKDALENGNVVTARSGNFYHNYEYIPIIGGSKLNQLKDLALTSETALSEADRLMEEISSQMDASKAIVEKENIMQRGIQILYDEGDNIVLRNHYEVNSTVQETNVFKINKNMSPEDMNKTLRTIYIDEKNITDIINKPINAETLPEYMAKIREAMSLEGNHSIAIMEKNMPGGKRTAVVPHVDEKNLTREQMQKYSEMVVSAKRAEVDCRKDRIAAVRDAKPKLTIEKLVGKPNDPNGKDTDFFAWIDDYNKEIRDANPGIAENDSRLLTYKSCLEQLNYFRFPQRPSLPFDFMSAYMLSRKDENGNNYTLDFILSDSAEAKEAKKRMGREFFEIFHAGVPGVSNPKEIHYEKDILACPALKDKYVNVMMPVLKNMLEAVANQKLEYVDYSSAKSIREGLLKQNLLSNIVVDLAQDLPDSFRPMALALSDAIKPATMYLRTRNEYILSKSYENDDAVLDRPDGGLSESLHNYLYYDTLFENAGEDTYKRMTQVPIGLLDINTSRNIVVKQHRGEEIPVVDPFIDRKAENLGDTLSALANGTLTRENTSVPKGFSEDFDAALKKAEDISKEGKTTPIERLYDATAPSRTNITIKNMDELRNMSTPQLFSRLSGLPLVMLQNFDQEGFKIALDKICVNGVPISQSEKFGFRRLNDQINRAFSSLSADNPEDVPVIAQIKELSQHHFETECERAREKMLKMLEDSLFKGESRDFLMVKTSALEGFAAFMPPVVPEPGKKPEKISGFKWLAASRAEIRANEEDIKNYEKRVESKRLNRDILDDIKHQEDMLSNVNKTTKNVNKISVNVLQRNKEEVKSTTVTYEPTKPVAQREHDQRTNNQNSL